MSYRYYGPPQPLLLGYDPVRDLPLDHLVRCSNIHEAERRSPPA